MNETESNMEVVTCVCGNELLMKSECDFNDVETDTWTFNVGVECHDSLNGCCKDRIKMGIDNIIQGVIMLKEMAELDRNYVINIEVPDEMQVEEE